MKKSLIVLTVVSIALSTTLFAQESRGDEMRTHKCDSKISKHSHHKTHCKKHYKKHHKKRGHNKHSRDRGSFKKVFAKLNLDATQKSQIRAIFKEQRKNRDTKKSHRKRDMKRDMPNIASFMSADKFDKDGFKKAMMDREAKRYEMRQERKAKMLAKKADTMEKIFAILTPKQREDLIKLYQKR